MFSLIFLLMFPDVLTQKSLCETQADKIKRIELQKINSAEEIVQNFLILMCAGEKQEAEKILKYGDDNFQDNFLIKFNLGNFYIREGKLDFAIFYLNQAKRINPAPQVFESISTAHLYRGDLKSSKSILDEAISKLHGVSREELLQIFIKRGYISLLLNEAADSEKFFRKAIEIDPANPYPYIGLAEAFGMQKKDQSAIEVISKVSSLTDDPILHLYSAVFLHSKGYLEMATSFYISSSDKLISPLRYLSKLLLSSAQRDLGMYIDSKENYEEVIKNYPQVKTAKVPFFPEYRLKLALAFLEKGNVKGIEAEIRDILKASPENPEAQKVLVEVLLMKSLLFLDKLSKIKSLEEAREIAKKYIDRNPSDDEMLYRFALINFWLSEIGPKFARSGNLMHAISSLQSALKLKEKKEYLELLGICYYVLEKYDDAIENLQKVAEQNYILKLILSSAYLKYGDPEKALKILQSIGPKQDRIYALLMYNILKAKKAENLDVIEQAIMEENYNLLFGQNGRKQEDQEVSPQKQKQKPAKKK